MPYPMHDCLLARLSISITLTRRPLAPHIPHKHCFPAGSAAAAAANGVTGTCLPLQQNPNHIVHASGGIEQVVEGGLFSRRSMWAAATAGSACRCSSGSSSGSSGGSNGRGGPRTSIPVPFQAKVGRKAPGAGRAVEREGVG